MEYMQAILHSDAIERFKKSYPELVKTGQLDSRSKTKQDYLEFLTVIQDLKIIHLCVRKKTMQFTFYYPCDDIYPDNPIYKEHEKYIEVFQSRITPVPEEFIKKIIYDPRIGLGFCIQCQTEFPIETGCTQTKHIYGRCDPKNFIPYVNKEGKKVFKGARHYKHHSEWNPDEFIPYSPEKMEENRQIMRKQRAITERIAKRYENNNEPDKAENVRKTKLKEF